jgi:hypothetical protein
LASDWRISDRSRSEGSERRDLTVTPDLPPPSETPAPALIPSWLRQCAYVVAYAWGFALFLMLGTKGCDWVSEPSSTKVALGLASVVASLFGAAVLVSQIVRKIIETGRKRRVR